MHDVEHVKRNVPMPAQRNRPNGVSGRRCIQAASQDFTSPCQLAALLAADVRRLGNFDYDDANKQCRQKRHSMAINQRRRGRNSSITVHAIIDAGKSSIASACLAADKEMSSRRLIDDGPMATMAMACSRCRARRQSTGCAGGIDARLALFCRRRVV